MCIFHIYRLFVRQQQRILKKDQSCIIYGKTYLEREKKEREFVNLKNKLVHFIIEYEINICCVKII